MIWFYKMIKTCFTALLDSSGLKVLGGTVVFYFLPVRMQLVQLSGYDENWQHSGSGIIIRQKFGSVSHKT